MYILFISTKEKGCDIVIYTITFNPALDYIVEVEEFEKNEINRTKSELILPGGKGINVSIVLKNLEIDSTALGFIAGFTGKEIENRLVDSNIKTDFIEIEKGFSRINMKIVSDRETAVNGNGPEIEAKHIEKLYKKLDEIQNGDILVLSGSIPKTISSNIYEQICEYLQERDVKIIVDATGDLLLNVLKYRPFLIKPNRHELGEIFNIEIEKKEDAIIYGKKLQELGAKNVLISMGGKGAVLIDENGEEYFSKAPGGTRVNTVGAGDSMVAGFIAGYLKNNKYEEAFKMGIATGSASACSKYLATKEEVFNLLKNI